MGEGGEEQREEDEAKEGKGGGTVGGVVPEATLDIIYRNLADKILTLER